MNRASVKADLDQMVPAHYGTTRSRRIWTKCVRRFRAGVLPDASEVYVGFTPRIRRPIAFICTPQGVNLFGEDVYAVRRIDNYPALRLADSLVTVGDGAASERTRACAN